MNEEIDEMEFYHQDFTTASDWEIFTARVEEIINQWKQENLDNVQTAEIINNWHIKSENLTFVDFDFKLLLYKYNIQDDLKVDDDKVKKTPFHITYDFSLDDPSNSVEHDCLRKWYGLNEYIVLSPVGNVGVTSESRIKLLLSTLYIAASNLKTEYPLFVQIREKWQNCYMGVYENESIRTNLEMVHLKTGLRLYQYLTGLLHLFKSKIVSDMMSSTIVVSLQSTYHLSNFGSSTWRQDYVYIEDFDNPMSDIYFAPFGVVIDPIDLIKLKATWSHLGHRSVRDNESYSDFNNPLQAHKWSIAITTTDQPLSFLGESFSEILNLSNNSATVYDVLGDFVTPVVADVNNPLDLLTEPTVPTISSLLTRAARNSLTKTHRRGTAPLSEDILVPLLYFLFPDADQKSQHTYDSTNALGEIEPPFDLGHECRGFKTCKPNSLLWRLSIVLLHALQSLGGIRAFSHLWFEFAQEMRYRWEKCISIPGLQPGSPDLRTTLLHQKLQMLNCCIERKHQREHATPTFDSAEGSSTEDEEFFDCADAPQTESRRSLWNRPVGRLGRFGTLKLLTTGDALYVPATQEPVPKTEDQLEEDTDVLLRLGADAQGSELRAKMMSASLLSDMESFKAANPGAILEDFIRWYSPRDWLEGEGKDEWGQPKGELSSRMRIEGNFWVQTWESAKPVPAARQKRLFDDTREAEKVLHFLESRTLGQVCELLGAVWGHVGLWRLAEEGQQAPWDCGERLRTLAKSIERISRDKFQTRRFEALSQEVTALEIKISLANSLAYKLAPTGALDSDLREVITGLVEGREVMVEGGASDTLGKRLIAMFTEAQGAKEVLEQVVEGSAVFPQPSEREMVMRVAVPRPATCSAECVQFMRAVLKKNEYRLVGAFSEDIVFF